MEEEEEIQIPQLEQQTSLPPSLPQPIFEALRAPRLMGTTREECYKFYQAYKNYKEVIQQRNRDNGTWIHISPIKQCMDGRIFRRLWRYGMRLRKEEEATESSIQNWIEEKIKFQDSSDLVFPLPGLTQLHMLKK